ncbi:hypothetical protein O0235_04075 [Tepidiforma flava]|uniref:CDP-alcohol phosphatidyltransferase family protein n=1 Tax=Tepidiforma flava TaxID=3004094 RepID=A0ABY7M880_9CHLR|nr:hypothetical protein [Tepidiforma flava]WBL36744.1 hypothetical protein O0235_04075 [Tepidiforma flava]
MNDAAVLAVIVAVRGLVPLLIFRWNLAGALLAIAADGSDAIIQDVLGAEPLRGCYHEFDKVFDTYYLTIELGVALRWGDPVARWMLAGLFALRLLGIAVFELTGAREVILFAPNVFENYYLVLAGLRSIRPGYRLRGWGEAVLWLAAVTPPKVLQEYVMHYREAQTWHFVRDEIFTPWN